MTVIRMERTPTRTTIKGPGFMCAMYGSGLREHALTHVGNYNPNLAELEAGVMVYYSDCNPRNHFGKFANRRF